MRRSVPHKVGSEMVTKHNRNAHQLELEGVEVNYGTIKALRHVSLTCSCGQSLALIGPNGSGKSTLLKAIAGLVPLHQGVMRWRGDEVQRWSKEFAYLPQREEVDWSFPITVQALVEMGRYPHLGLWRKYAEEDERVVSEAMEKLGLIDLAGRQIGELSGGQQQRAFIARALAQEAHVLLLDEPFTGLDRPSADRLAELFSELTAEGRLVIAAHHDLESAGELFDLALLLGPSGGFFGPVRQVLTRKNLSEVFPDCEFFEGGSGDD